MNPIRIAASVCILTFSLSTSAATAATEVTACEQPYVGDGYLSADLDCGGGTSDVHINGGSLDLAGFTLTANVRCEGIKCAVFSTGARGRIVDGDIYAYTVGFSTQISALRVENLDISGGGISVVGNATIKDVLVENAIGDGIAALYAFSEIAGYSGGNAAIYGSKIRGCSGQGVAAGRRISMGDTEVSFNGFGVSTTRGYAHIERCTIVDNLNGGIAAGGGSRALKLTDSVVDRNGSGISASAGKVQVVRSSVSQNEGAGIRHFGNRTKLVDSTVDGNGWHGLQSWKSAKLQGSSFQGNGGAGVYLFNEAEDPSRLNIRDCTFLGNSTSVECGVEEPCADIVTKDAPRVAASSCETSHELGSVPAADWDVCTLD